MKIKISQTPISIKDDPVSEALHLDLQSSIRDSFKLDHEKFDSMKTKAGNLIRDILTRFPFVPPTPGYHPALDYNYLELAALTGKHFLYRMKRVEAEFLLKYLQNARLKSKVLFELKYRLREELDAFMYTLRLFEKERLSLKELFDKAHQAQMTKTQLHFERWAHQLMLHAELLNRRKDALDTEISIERVGIENLKSSLSSSRTNLFFPANFSFLQLLETCPLPFAAPLTKQFHTYHNEYNNSFAILGETANSKGKGFGFLHSKFFSKGIWDELWKVFLETQEVSLRSALVVSRAYELKNSFNLGELQTGCPSKGNINLPQFHLVKDHSSVPIKSPLSNGNSYDQDSYFKNEFPQAKLDIHLNPYQNSQMQIGSNFVRFESKNSSIHVLKSQDAKIHFKNLQKNIDDLYKFNLSRTSIQSQTQETLQLNLSKSTFMEADRASVSTNLPSPQAEPRLDSEELLEVLPYSNGPAVSTKAEVAHIIWNPSVQAESENIDYESENQALEDSLIGKKMVKG